MKSPFRSSVVLAVALSLALAGCASGATPGASPSPTTADLTVSRGDLTDTLSWTATLAYANPVSLTFGAGASGTTRGGAPATAAAYSFATLAATSPSPSPSPSVSPTPTSSPSPSPSVSPTPSPSVSPTPSPTPTPSPKPSPTPSAPSGGSSGGTRGSAGGSFTGGTAGTPSLGTGGTTSTPSATGAAASASGLVTWLPTAGSTLASGDSIYRVNNVPVVLLEGTATLYRSLTVGDTGDDVRAVEKALAALGYDDGGVMTVDTTFTAATAIAVKAFQTAMGLTATGVLDPATVVMHDGPVVASTLVAAVGDAAGTGTEILVVSDPARDATFELDPAQLTSVVVGDTLSVSLPQGGTADATISSIASAPSTNGKYAVTARLATATIQGDQWQVKVSFTRTLAKNALLVDPSALVLVEGGGTVVRVRRSGAVVDVPVTVVATAGRSSAVEGAGLAEGDAVVP